MVDQARYVPDRRGMGELMRSPEMQGAMELACYEAIPVARAISPDAPPYGEGYVAAFEVDGGHIEKIAGTRRATAYLVNDTDHSAFVENGAHGTEGHHVLTRAMHALGFR